MKVPDKRKEFASKRVIIQCDPALIADVHTVVESCDYLAVVRTLEPDMGILELIATTDTFQDALAVSRSLEKLLGAKILHPPQASR
jgi:hypothetical protein